MSVTRIQLSAGPAYAAFNGKNIAFASDCAVRQDLVKDVIAAALYGDVDEIYRDMIVRLSGTPLFYDTANIATMWPYINLNALGGPIVGQVFPGATALPCAITSNNGDVITLTSALIGKMPDLILGVKPVVLGSMEIWGVLPFGDDPATANSYRTIQTGQSYANPAVPGTAVIGGQEFTANWGAVTGFAPFQAQDVWTISHEMSLTPVVTQGRTRAFKITSYRAMAKCRPLGPTMAQIDAAYCTQGTGAFGGARLSAFAATTASNLVITGSQNMTVTIGNAVMIMAGEVFGGKELREGEIGFVSTLPIAAGGTSTAALTLAP